MQDTLNINIKAQDKLREWFSKRNSSEAFKISYVALGDSDMNYNLLQQKDKIKSFHTPFNSQEIKSKLVYEGDISNIECNIECYAVKIDSLGNLYSTINFPPDSLQYITTSVPKINNKNNTSILDFSGSSDNTPVTQVILMQSIPVNFSNQRLNEDYIIEYKGSTQTETGDLPTSSVPGEISYTKIDSNDNKSFILIGKNIPVQTATTGYFLITGKISGSVTKLFITLS